MTVSDSKGQEEAGRDRKGRKKQEVTVRDRKRQEETGRDSRSGYAGMLR